VVESRKSLVGDLEEQYAEGRSRFWYWRQTVATIAVGTLTAFRNDKLLAIRAVLGGIVYKIVWTWLLSVFTGSSPLRLSEGYVIPYIILALSGAGVAGSAVSKKPMTTSGDVGPMVLCWAAAWLTWTVVHAVFTHTNWTAVQSLGQTLSIVTAGLLIPLKSRDNHDELITLRL
jgi:hypothetical protein